MPYSSYVVAAFVINYCNNKGCIITNMRLNKLLYFIQAEFLVRKNDVCFSEDILAWEYGPVIREVYTICAIFGNTPLPKDVSFLIANFDLLKSNDKDIIIDVIESCKEFSTLELVQITRNQTPWLQAKNLPSKIIRPDTIKDFFGKGE